MTFQRFLLKVLYLNEHLYNLYKRDKYYYHLDIFKKKKYRFLLSNNNFLYDGNIFYYHLDESYKCNYSDKLVDNISINYNFVVNKSLNELFEKNPDKAFTKFMNEYLMKIRKCVEISESSFKDNILLSLDNFFNKGAFSLFDALQRILFINALMWQTGHRLNVLGRLDYILNDIYENDKSSKEDKKELIKEFLRVLHENYYYKSNALKGDTGQVIILGGLNVDGSNFHNELTSLFIECVKELQLPDPKVLLRVSKNTPKELFKQSLECIETGCGSPLLSNDDVVIPGLMDIGYPKEDACNYATSACWEPLCDGSSLEQNNFDDINFIKILNSTVVKKANTFDELLNQFEVDLRKEIVSVVNKLNKFKFAYDPLLSTFLADCLEKGKDVSEGGARYNNFGILTTGLGNAVNALLNVKKFVFDEKKYSLEYLVLEAKKNFPNEELIKGLKNTSARYGKDEPAVIELTNRLIAVCNDEFSKYQNQLGGKYRFGLSSPNYMANSSSTKASLDGRRDFEPFIVHISCDSECSYSELMHFSSSLTYGNRNVNGNVVDVMISPSFINNNFDKFLSFLRISFDQGIFQAQFNVVDSKTLIAAKENPDKYSQLIVRVWGFSAYFVELPESYQNLLIERAINSENANR